jgi:predicted metal-dependent hydrolase
MSLLPSYTHIVNPKLKHIYLSFDSEGKLIIKSPKVSYASIEKILLKKSAWITKSQSKIALKKGKALRFQGEEEIYYLGKSYPLECIQHTKKQTKLLFDENTFILYYHTFDTLLFQKHIDAFYKKTAQEIIIPFVTQWSEIMQVDFSIICFRKTKRQWGSCSSTNRLSFNTMMMKLPLAVIQYIVVHELAHIKHKHHQKEFWDLIACYLPEYKTQVKELKNYTT